VKNAHDSQNSKSSNGDKKMATEPEKTRSISPDHMTTKDQTTQQNTIKELRRKAGMTERRF
jgi:DNA-binding transcriptional regulator YiaG